MRTERNDGGNLEDWIANKTRVLRAGLRDKDEETVATVLEEVKSRYGKRMTDKYYLGIVNRMIREEGFNFEND